MNDQTNNIAAKRASGSSFYTAMRILPQEQREAIYEIYSFCRAVDDVADEEGPRPARLAELAQWRVDVDALYAGTPPARLKNLAGPLQTFGFRREDFHAIIDGMEMDVLADIRAPDMNTLDLYCDRVASAVGRLCVKVFGTGDEAGMALAHHLGRALQLTNILRDIDEDAAIGRLYLPQEALNAAGITTTDPLAAISSPTLGAACEPVIARAREHFREADAIMRRCPRRTVRAPRIMAEAYRPMLDRLTERGFAAPRHRIHVNRLYLVWILVRNVIF
ncbi:MAG TPA: presqualene diphosphate synthase HpnD [Xanthobacteraceae bacterium]|nr:presqualene diphosphate synthase HpnD [Xanthobacteraceae bacterium]